MDPRFFRSVLGHFPTGVVAITSLSSDGKPVGMAIGSFTSVSLEPPLVAFLPDHTSSTWPAIRSAGHFSVNFLASDQEVVCRALATKGDDKFEQLRWRPGPTGAPLIDGAVGWIACEIEEIHEAGDHDIVIGRVLDLSRERDTLPLLFFQGGYGRFEPLSLSAWADDLTSLMTMADLARPHMEELTRQLPVECLASAVAGNDMALTATAGPLHAKHLTSRVGNRIPFEPPLGTVFAAFGTDVSRDRWLALAEGRGSEFTSAARRTVESVRMHGYSFDLGYDWHDKMEHLIAAGGAAQDPAGARTKMQQLIAALEGNYESPHGRRLDGTDVGTINVPVFGESGTIAMTLSTLGKRLDEATIATHVAALRLAADAVSRDLKRAGLG